MPAIKPGTPRVSITNKCENATIICICTRRNIFRLLPDLECCFARLVPVAWMDCILDESVGPKASHIRDMFFEGREVYVWYFCLNSRLTNAVL